MRLAKCFDRLADGIIINRLRQVVGGPAWGKVVRHLNGDEQFLWFRPLLIRHADVKLDLQVLNGDSVSHQRELPPGP